MMCNKKYASNRARALGVAAAVVVAFASAPAAAYVTYFGEDLNNSPTSPLSSFANASNAETNFLSQLTGVGTETFTGHTGIAPQSLTFPGSSGSLTATLAGGNGSFSTVTTGSTNGAGRYGVSGGTTDTYWEVAAGGGGNFNIVFNQAVAAFGFYGIDIGDFGGQVTLVLTQSGGSTVNFTVPNTVGSTGSSDGSVLFYGLIAGAGEQFTNVSFNTTTGQGDIFAFDNMTVGDLEQVNPTPEPASIALLGLGLAGLVAVRRRRLV